MEFRRIFCHMAACGLWYALQTNRLIVADRGKNKPVSYVKKKQEINS